MTRGSILTRRTENFSGGFPNFRDHSPEVIFDSPEVRLWLFLKIQDLCVMISSNVSLKSILRSVITKCPNLVEYLHQNLRALPQTLNAPTETINESSSEATNSNVLEMISAEVNKNYIQTHFEDYNNSDDEDSESDEE